MDYDDVPDRLRPCENCDKDTCEDCVSKKGLNKSYYYCKDCWKKEDGSN